MTSVVQGMGVVYGHCENNFIWRNPNSRSMFQTTGLIVETNDKKYVVTTRNYLIGCSDIFIYLTDEEDNMSRYDLQIVSHSIEHNTIILEADAALPAFNVSLTVAKKKHYLIKNDIRFESETNFVSDIVQVKCVAKEMCSYSYTPDVFLYKYRLDIAKKISMDGILGSVIVSSSGKIIGMVIKSIDDIVLVLPYRIIQQFVNTCDQNNYWVDLPFTYTANDVVRINEKTFVKSVTGNKILKQDDIIQKIDDYDINIKDDRIWIRDEIYQKDIHVEYYMNLHNVDTVHELTILRKEKTLKIAFYCQKSLTSPMISNVSLHQPIIPIPFINYHDAIIVQLTHELIDIMFRNKKIVSNAAIDKILNGNETDNCLMIIDCLNSNLNKKFKFPKFKKNKQIINAPIILKVNDQTITDLDELKLLLEYQETVTITYDINSQTKSIEL